MNAKEQQANRISRVDRAAAILDRALELNSPERNIYMEGACGDDVELRNEVEAMLRAHEEAGDFLAAPTNENTATIPSFPNEKPGAIIDRYKLLEQIGEGGFGIVYLAEQTEPVRRQVALKIIKLGMDTKQVIARFEAERQALAMMDHPNIARVFDAGATETGRPYFVMELVKGVSITEHCDRQRLNIQERLELFMQVCEAVQHAHQKAIIHRDLKPLNILVSLREGKPLVKVIDFGIAKAISHRLTEKTLYTEQGQLIGTPEYMSPEQAEMTAQDIDTRSDIYSLGVLLYELLTGALPFDLRTLRQAAFGEIQRIIREEEPPKPSTRLSSLGDESTPYAQKRRANPRSLLRELRGDLDWITMKALEKDRTRRYSSASEFAHDLQRHLEDEPVLAGPPSAAYRIKKFIHRHKVAAASMSAVSFALLIGVIGTTRMAIIASQRQQEAEAARDAAIRQAELVIVADASMIFGFGDEAAADAKRALDINVRALGPNHPNTIDAETNLAYALALQGRLAEAEQHARHALDGNLRAHGKDHREVIPVMAGLAIVLARQGKVSEAEHFWRLAVETSARLRGDKHPATLVLMDLLGNVYLMVGRYAEAEVIFAKTLELRRRVHGDEHPDTLNSMRSLAFALGGQGKLAAAEELVRRAVELHVHLLGEEHPDTLSLMETFARGYRMVERYDEAVSLYVRALEVRGRVHGYEHSDTLKSMRSLAKLYEDQSRHNDAESLLRRVLAVNEESRGPDDAGTIRAIEELAHCLIEQGKFEDTERLLHDGLTRSHRAFGARHKRTRDMLAELGRLYRAWGKPDKAAQWRAKLPEGESANEQDE